MVDRLKYLLKEKIIVQENGIYKMSHKGRKIVKLLKEIVNVMNNEKIYENIEALPNLFRNYLNNFFNTIKENFREILLSVILFGSVARGKWTNKSDIDLFLIMADEFSKESRIYPNLIELKINFYKTNFLRNENGDLIFHPIQIIPLVLKNLKNFRTTFYDIAVDGIILYDKNKTGLKFIEEIKKRIKILGLKRILDSNGNFYWQHKEIKFGEIIEI